MTGNTLIAQLKDNKGRYSNTSLKVTRGISYSNQNGSFRYEPVKKLGNYNFILKLRTQIEINKTK